MNRSRRLLVENLETRSLLAGNVTVAVNGGSVTVTGDDARNVISIYQQPNGRFNIVGYEGETFAGPTNDLVIRNLTVKLQGGDDMLGIGKQSQFSISGEPAQILGTTKVDGGTGANIIVVSVNGREFAEHVMPAASIEVDTTQTAAMDPSTPFRDDDVLITRSSATMVTSRTGAGNDVLTFHEVQALQLTGSTGPDSTPTGMTDDDLMEIDGVVALNTNVALGGGTNHLLARNLLVGKLTATTGSGDDQVQLSDSVIATSFTLNTNRGADHVELHDVQVGLERADYPVLANEIAALFGFNLASLPVNFIGLLNYLPSLPGFMIILTGDGDDVVTMMDVTSTMAISVSLEGGDDQLFATDIDAFYSTFNGGLGTDGENHFNIEGYSWLFLFEEELPPPNAT